MKNRTSIGWVGSGRDWTPVSRLQSQVVPAGGARPCMETQGVRWVQARTAGRVGMRSSARSGFERAGIGRDFPPKGRES
jgi:hypothetical protein